jgi:hypothetical protein
LPGELNQQEQQHSFPIGANAVAHADCSLNLSGTDLLTVSLTLKARSARNADIQFAHRY